MPLYLRQSTASQEVPLGYFVDSTDGNTEETGLTIANTDIMIWKTGATTLANKNSGGGTHISNGIYYAVLDATDTDTIGPLVMFVHVSGALTVRLEYCVLDEAVYDVLFGTTALATTTNITAGTITTATNVTTVNGLAAAVITAASIATDAITAAKIADGAIDAGALAADCITAAKIADGAIDAATFAAGAINAAAIAADAITDAKVASDVTIASVTGAVGSVTGAVGSIGTGGITTASFGAGAIDAAAIATDAIGASELAASAVSEIQSGLSTLSVADIQAALVNAGLVMNSTTIATLASQTSFTLTAGSDDNDAYNGCVIVVTDASTATQKAVGVVLDYTGSTKTVTLATDPAVFTMAATDLVDIIPCRSLKPTVDNRTLDVLAGAVVNVDLVDTLTTYTGNTVQTGDSFARLTGTGAVTFASLTVSGATTFTGAVSLSSTFGITGAITATNASNNLRLGTFTVDTNAIAWNASWDAEVQSEVQDAIEANHLDHFIAVADPGGVVANSSFLAKLVSKSATPAFSSYDNTTDSHEALRDNHPSNFSSLGINGSGHVSRVTLTDTVTTYTGNTVQTGDSFSRLGAPAGVSVSADLAAVKSDTTAILDDTGTAGVVVASGSKTGYSLAAGGLDSITATDPAGVASTFPAMLVQLWRRFFKKSTMTTTQLKTYGDDGTTVRTTQGVSDDGTTQTQGAAS